jgi:hypothetical protein
MPRADRINDDVSLQEIGVAILRAVPQIHAECEMVAYCLMLFEASLLRVAVSSVPVCRR